LPQDHVVSQLETRTPGFACTPRERNPVETSQRSEEPGYWASTSNPSVAKIFNQIRTTVAQCEGAPSCWKHISRRTKGTTSSSSGKVSWRNVRSECAFRYMQNVGLGLSCSSSLY
jgi:hypothetical protein